VINDEDENSETALHLAALAGNNKVVQALIDAGADIAARYGSNNSCCKSLIRGSWAFKQSGSHVTVC
jgi:ankyrin repeat protein